MTLANTLVLALGAMVVAGVDHAIVATRLAFDAGWQSQHADTTHWIVATDQQPFDEQLYVDLVRRLHGAADPAPGIDRLTAVVEGEVVLGQRRVPLIGVDVFGGVRRARGGPVADVRGVTPALLVRPGAVLVGADIARRDKLQVGDRVEVRPVEPWVRPARPLLVAGISGAAGVAGDVGRLSRIEVVVRQAPHAPWLELLDRLFPGLGAGAAPADPGALTVLLPPGLELRSAAGERLASQRLADAFFFNLGALSLLALVVAVFLVFQSTAFNVLRRRTMIARFRGLGLQAGEVRTALVLEAAALGTVAGVLGTALGVALALVLVDRVGATVSDLFFRNALAELQPQPLLMLKALLLCVGGAVVAGALAARRPQPSPARGAQPGMLLPPAGQPLWRVAGVLALAAAAALLAWLPSGSAGALLAIGCALLACALAMTDVLRGVLYGLRRVVTGRWLAAAWLLGDVRRHLLVGAGASRALMIAVATSVGMVVMIASFRVGFSDWLYARVGDDAYVLAAADAQFDEATRTRLLALPQVGEVLLRGSQRRTLAVGGVVRRVELVWGQHVQGALARYGAPAGFDPGREVLVSEPLARAWRLGVGDELALGSHRYRIAHVFREYGGQTDLVVMDRAAFERSVGMARARTLAIRAAPGVPVGELLAAVQTALPDAQVRSGADIRQLALEVFDRTFVVADVIRMLALVVALAGMLTAFAAMQLARRYENGVARAIGVRRAELVAAAMAQALMLGMLVLLVALPAGLLVAWLLVELVNARAFGWTFALVLPLAPLVATALLALAGAALAGLAPALDSIWRRPVDDLRQVDA